METPRRGLTSYRNRWSSLPLLGKGLVLVAVPVVALLATVTWSYWSEHAESGVEADLRRELETLTVSQQALTQIVDVETGGRGYLLTGQDGFLEPYRQGERDLGPTLARLEALVKDQPAQLERLKGLDGLIRQREQLVDTLVANRAVLSSSPARIADIMTQGKSTQDALRRGLAAVQADAQHRIEAGLATGRRARSRRVVTVVAGTLTGVGAGLLALGLFSVGIVRRIRLLEENARCLASGDALPELPPGEDEVGRLGQELRKTAQLLGEQNEHLRLSFEATQIRFWEYDPATGRISWPESKFSFSRADRQPADLPALLERLHPDDRSTVQGAFEAASRSRDDLDVEFRLPVKGQDRWFVARGRFVGDREGTPRLLGLVLDVTNRKMAEQAVRESEAGKTAILASMGDGVLITDTGGTIVSVNPAMERLSGWSSDEICGQPFGFFTLLDLKGEPVPLENRPLAMALASGRPQAIRGYDRILVCRDGSRVPLAGSAAPIIDDQGNLLGGVAVVRDVSYEREVDQLKSSLISTVSHELRTPLTMIQGFSELILTRRPPPGKAEEALRHINSSAQRLARLIDDLLAVSRIESGRTDVRRGRIDLQVVFDEIAAEFREQRPIETGLDPQLTLLLADPDMLVRILTNLVSNAVKYSPPGSPVRLTARREGRNAEISVTDSGVGMSEAERGRLFERFFRADREEVQKAGGTGLGLYIAKSLVEMQGGRIWVETELGRGSTFTFSLPLAAAQQRERVS